jgi:Transcriptional regulators
MKEPLSLQIYKDLYEKIKCHFYQVGEQLPIEKELEEWYQVSKAPVRQALAKLEADGLIYRRAGKGTFVSSQIKKEQPSVLGGFGIHFMKFANQWLCKTLNIELIITKKHQEKTIGFPAQTPLVLVSRVRSVAGEPIFFLNHYIANFDIGKVKAAGDIQFMRQFLQENGIDIEYVSEKIKATAADNRLSEVLSVPLGYPLLQINRISYDKDYRQLVYETYYVKSDNWDYQVQFKASFPKK